MNSRINRSNAIVDESHEVEAAIQSVRELTALSLSIPDQQAVGFGTMLRSLVCRDTVRNQIRYLTDLSSVNTDEHDAGTRLAEHLKAFQSLVADIRASLVLAVDFKSRCSQLFDLANQLFGNAPTWVCFYREVLSSEGLLQVVFPNWEEQSNFSETTEFCQLQQMLTALRSRDMPENDANDPQRMITVRLPRSLHLAICEEAAQLGISVNKLVVSRLLQTLDIKMVPERSKARRAEK